VLVVLIVVAVVAVVVIGLVTVGRVTYRLEAEPPTSVYDIAEAVEFVAERLPDDVTAQLTFDELHDLLVWHVEYLEDRGVARESGDNVTSGPLVAAEDEALAYVLGHAGDAGIEVEDVWVVQVIDASGEYLEAIGAIAGEVPAPIDPDDPDGPA
jgi:hypothetical protein